MTQSNLFLLMKVLLTIEHLTVRMLGLLVVWMQSARLILYVESGKLSFYNRMSSLRCFI